MSRWATTAIRPCTIFDLWKLIYYGDYILQQTTFYRRKVFDSVDLLDESLCYGMDWDLFIRIGRRFRVDYLPQYLGSIREHGEAKTSTGGVRRFREIVQIIRRHGIRRYPQAYFNYAWDVVSPYVHDPASGSSMMFSRKIVGTSAWVGQRLLRLFWHRLGQGKFDDGWLGRRAMIVLPNKEPEANEKHLVIKGELPAQNAPMNVRLRVNKRLVTEQQLTEPGEFTIAAELSNGVGKAESFHITVDNGRTFVPKSHGISDDCRELGFLLKSIDVVPGPKPESAPGRATEGETASATDVRGKWMSTVLKFGLLALLVALAAMRLDLSSTFRYLSGRTVLYILALQPLVLLCALAMTKRFEVLLQSPGVPYRTIFKAIILANGINVILPARLSEVLKATYINEKTGHSVSRSVSAVVLERIGDIMVFLSLAFASLGSVLFRVNAVYLSAIALAIILGLATLAGSQRLIVGFAERLRSPLLSRFLKQFVTHAAGSLRSRSFYVGQMYGVLAWSCSYLLMTIFIEFNGSISLGFSQTMVLFTATTVGLLIPLLPGGMGTYEAAAVYVLKGFGYSFEEALALALALHLSQLLLFFVLSLVIVAREHLGISRLIKRLRSLSAAGEGSGTSERV